MGHSIIRTTYQLLETPPQRKEGREAVVAGARIRVRHTLGHLVVTALKGGHLPSMVSRNDLSPESMAQDAVFSRRWLSIHGRMDQRRR